MIRLPRVFSMGAALALLFTLTGHAATLQKNFSLTTPTVGLDVTAPNTGYIEQFDANTYGTLTEVSVSYEVAVEISNSLYNSSSGDSYAVYLQIAGSLTIDMPSGTQVMSASLGHTTSDGKVAYTYTPVPEPSAYALIGVGLAALIILRKRRR